MYGPVLVGAAKTSDEMVFPASNGLFGCIMSMNVRQDQLVGDIVLFHNCFQSWRSFIVEFLEKGF
jgi:hypothetical protein